MNRKNRAILLSVLAVVLLIADQALKIWVKTSFTIGETVVIFPDWFKLCFIENNGAAYGMSLTFGDGFDWGKLLLSVFRVVLIGGLGYYIYRLIKRKAPMGVLVGLTLIFAGAVGNMIDSAFYGLLFTESTERTVATFGGNGSFMMGKVVDMFSFPLFQWKEYPKFLSFLFDDNGYFFGPIFNLADSYISVAVVYLLLFQHKYFK